MFYVSTRLRTDCGYLAVADTDRYRYLLGLSRPMTTANRPGLAPPAPPVNYGGLPTVQVSYCCQLPPTATPAGPFLTLPPAIQLPPASFILTPPHRRPRQTSLPPSTVSFSLYRLALRAVSFLTLHHSDDRISVTKPQTVKTASAGPPLPSRGFAPRNPNLDPCRPPPFVCDWPALVILSLPLYPRRAKLFCLATRPSRLFIVLLHEPANCLRLSRPGIPSLYRLTTSKSRLRSTAHARIQTLPRFQFADV